MDVKTLFGLTVIPAAFFGGSVVACLSKRMRDLFFALLVFSSPLIERLDLNYVSREWYRGTSRGFEICVSDILAFSLLVSAVLVPRRGQSRWYWPPSLGLMLLFFFYCCFNVGISEPRLFGLFELFRYVRGFVLVLAVAFYVRSQREIHWFLFSLGLVIGFESLLALKQRYFDGFHRVFGTLDESNSLSVLLCTSAPVMVAAVTSAIPKPLKLFCALTIPLACVGEILTISRAGVIILGVVLLGATLSTASLRFRPRTIVCALVILLGAGGLLAKSWKTLGTRFAESTLKQEYGNKKNLGRGYYIRIARAISNERWFGVGLNNWSFWVSNYYGPKQGYRFVPYRGTEHEPSTIIPPSSNVDMAQAAPAHNLGALTLGELGIPGLVLFTVLWFRWFGMAGSFLRPRSPDPVRRIAVGIFFGFCGMFLQCLTEWVFRHLPLYYTFNVLLGVLMSLCYLKQRSDAAAKHRTDEQEETGFSTPSLHPSITPSFHSL